MIAEVDGDQRGQGGFGICQVGHMQSREVDIFRGARTRHPREHAHPALQEPLGLLAVNEDPGQESVVPCLTDLSVDGGCTDAGTSQSGCLLCGVFDGEF